MHKQPLPMKIVTGRLHVFWAPAHSEEAPAASIAVTVTSEGARSLNDLSVVPSDYLEPTPFAISGREEVGIPLSCINFGPSGNTRSGREKRKKRRKK